MTPGSSLRERSPTAGGRHVGPTGQSGSAHPAGDPPLSTAEEREHCFLPSQQQVGMLCSLVTPTPK